jgi:type VI secretion system protein ImpM
MAASLFGKLPAKRDFIAVHAPREFLAIWEPWMQGGMTASQLALGPRWKETYYHAPIWRFWLGSGVAGVPTLGAFMPSLDGVGRDYPLVVFARAAAGRIFAPPTVDPQADWFAAAEDFLLGTLDEAVPYEATQVRLAALGAPRDMAESPLVAGEIASQGPYLIADPRDPSAEAALAVMAGAERDSRLKGASYWWTLGGEGTPARAIRTRGMPDPFSFADFLTGTRPGSRPAVPDEPPALPEAEASETALPADSPADEAQPVSEPASGALP